MKGLFFWDWIYLVGTQINCSVRLGFGEWVCDGVVLLGQCLVSGNVKGFAPLRFYIRNPGFLLK